MTGRGQTFLHAISMVKFSKCNLKGADQLLLKGHRLGLSSCEAHEAWCLCVDWLAIGIVIVSKFPICSSLFHNVWRFEEVLVVNLDSALLYGLELWNDERVFAHLVPESLLGLVGGPDLLKQALWLLL